MSGPQTAFGVSVNKNGQCLESNLWLSRRLVRSLFSNGTKLLQSINEQLFFCLLHALVLSAIVKINIGSITLFFFK